MEFDLGTLLCGISETNLPDPCMWQYYKNLENNVIIVNQEIGDGYTPVYGNGEKPDCK